ncbi:MAG: N-acetyltransferase [Acidobacteria bacterium OLB17]|nr:MAG: N-acetyltransferase [Acidobacteria bacterium OLB17]MCZ2389874.1 GNAT family N-acetyltransferase [Acidobacteriota bacterium]
MTRDDINIRECATVEELSACVALQREVFALPEVELSPVRHFIVTKNAGGFTLGAYDGGRLAGFVLSVPAVMHGERALYSHMTAVSPEYQSLGLGAALKWAQRARALEEGIRYIKWTFEPVKARNAYFNLEKLGATVSDFQENFYGTDYGTAPEQDGKRIGLASDRLFAEWDLQSDKVQALAAGEKFVEPDAPTASIQIMPDWLALVAADPQKAKAEQLRIRTEFKTAFDFGMICRGFYRDDKQPAYLLYKA